MAGGLLIEKSERSPVLAEARSHVGRQPAGLIGSRSYPPGTERLKFGWQKAKKSP